MPEKIQSLFGLARSLGASVDLALGLQAILAALLVGFIVWLWRRRDASFELKAAALAAAMTLASPYQFVYDLVILTVAQAFLLRHLAHSGAKAIDILGLVVANVLIFCFATTGVPLGFVASLLVMGLILRHVVAERASRTDDGAAAVGAQLSGGCSSSVLPAAGA